MKKLLMLVTALALFGAACGSDDGGSDSDLSAAIADAIMADADSDVSFGEDEAQCAADAVVDTIGEDRLVELGATVEAIESGTDMDDLDLTEEEELASTEAMFDCIDISAMMVEQFTADGMPEEDAECIADNLDADLFTQFLTSDATSDPDVMNQVIDVMSECNVTDFG